jgi:hypothetical protein
MAEDIKTFALSQLPHEIRQQVYKYVVLAAEEVRLHRIEASTEIAQGVGPLYLLSSSEIPMSEVNRQARQEISTALESSPVPLVSRVHDFNFDHIIFYLTASKTTQQLHTVRRDGTMPRKFVIELCGPYTEDWSDNLGRWVHTIATLLPEVEAEFGGLHKIVDTPRHSLFRASGHVRIMRAVQSMWLQRPRGAARLALEKIFFAFFCRWRTGPVSYWVYELNVDSLKWDSVSIGGRLPIILS